jgi:hypothetical protein
MFTAYVVVTLLAAAATAFAATADFLRPQWVLANMTRAGVPQSRLFSLGALKAAGALGLLVGLGVPLLGVAAAVGLVLFFVGAIITPHRCPLVLVHHPRGVSPAGRGLAGVATGLVLSRVVSPRAPEVSRNVWFIGE